MSIKETWSEQDDKIVIKREQTGLAAHVDYCKARANEGLHGPSSDFKLKASIPPIVIEHYLMVNQVTYREFMQNPEHARRLVNDPALADFRIAPGRM